MCWISSSKIKTLLTACGLRVAVKRRGDFLPQNCHLALCWLLFVLQCNAGWIPFLGGPMGAQADNRSNPVPLSGSLAAIVFVMETLWWSRSISIGERWQSPVLGRTCAYSESGVTWCVLWCLGLVCMCVRIAPLFYIYLQSVPPLMWALAQNLEGGKKGGREREI